jgi:hypothetical protein
MWYGQIGSPVLKCDCMFYERYGVCKHGMRLIKLLASSEVADEVLILSAFGTRARSAAGCEFKKKLYESMNSDALDRAAACTEAAKQCTAQHNSANKQTLTADSDCEDEEDESTVTISAEDASNASGSSQIPAASHDNVAHNGNSHGCHAEEIDAITDGAHMTIAAIQSGNACPFRTIPYRQLPPGKLYGPTGCFVRCIHDRTEAADRLKACHDAHAHS